MKLLYIHGEEKLKEDYSGSFYTSGSYNNKIWDRYSSISPNLTVMFRKETTLYETNLAKSKFQPFDKNKIGFIEIPDVTSSYFSFCNPFLRGRRNQVIKNAIKSHDLIIIRLPSSSGYIAAEYAESFNKPYVVEVVGCPRDSLWNLSSLGKLLAYPNFLLMKRSVKRAPYVVYVTQFFLQNRYPSDGVSISCSDVYLPNFDEVTLERRISKIESLDGGSPIVIGTIGAVDLRYKGQSDVIEALALLKTAGYDFEYHLVGGGQQNRLQSVAEKYGVADRVKFLGPLSHDQVFTFLDGIDIYIQPSRTEGLPRALIEAMSRGCPAVGAAVGGIPELLDQRCLFRSGSVREIKNLLVNMNAAEMKTQALRNFTKAKEFKWCVLEKNWHDFYKNLT